MCLFKKKDEAKQDVGVTEVNCENTEVVAEEPKEEWIWVEGYKGTNFDMTCHEFQYELDKQFDMDEKDVKMCESGFHLCLYLSDVFNYYDIGNSHRFFKVKALVRKEDYDRCRFTTNIYGLYPINQTNKLVAKSIIFTKELDNSEIFKNINISSECWETARQLGINGARSAWQTQTLVADGYSEPCSMYLVKNNKFEVAHAVGSQKDMSMDMKMLVIFH